MKRIIAAKSRHTVQDLLDEIGKARETLDDMFYAYDDTSNINYLEDADDYLKKAEQCVRDFRRT